ncbi:putative permease [gamma proteobacterium HIMB55]|nr:putative permease [gamma proteobacterium HIMB55]
MINTLKHWYEEHLTHKESVILVIIMASTFLLLATIGDVLMPVLVALILAYLMQGVADRLMGWGLNEMLALTGATLLFVGVFLGFTVGIAPLVWRQLGGLIREAPAMVEAVQAEVAGLIAQYPTMIEQAPIDELMSTLQAQAASFGQAVLGFGLSSIPGVLTFAIYMVLIPLMVFFFLKDREVILKWVLGFLPTDRPRLDQIGRAMNVQIANYVRGKGIEITIIGAVSYAAFTTFDLNYTALLALLVGLSVIVPYIGAFLVTIPVMLVALFQFGLTGDFYWVVGLYMLIQVLDGNVLVPLLFSEAVDLHPVAIIIAVLVFGGLWGVWGVFFAIPLATLCNVLLVSWPRVATE